MNKIAIYLNRHISGNVFDKDAILEAYSTDRSPLKIKPRFVAIPESTSDVRKLLRFVNQLSEKNYDLPVAVRGSGLSKTGSDLSAGLVLSTEKLNHVRELDAHDRLVHVQAGITLGKLNAVLAPHGLRLPISADPGETIGSLISNCPIDKHSKKYGGIMNYIDRIEVVLANGDLLQTSRLSLSKLQKMRSGKDLENKIYDKLTDLLDKNTDLIFDQSANSRLGYPALKHIRRNNNKIFDILPIFYGAEGSLGVITEVILRLDVLPPIPHRIFASFNTFKSAAEFAEYANKLAPLSVELFDQRIFKNAEEFGKKPDLLTKRFDEGFLVLASFDDKSRRSRKKIRKCLSFLPKSAYVTSETNSNHSDFDDFELSLSSYLNNTKGERLQLLHDFYVPPEALSAFLKDLKALEKSSKHPLELFGSYATGIYSLRPDFDLSKVDERRAAITLLRDLNSTLKTHSGFLAGGLPEGRLKSIIIYPELDTKEKKLYESIKDIFDKNHVLCPESKTLYNTRSAIRHLRTDINPSIVSE